MANTGAKRWLNAPEGPVRALFERLEDLVLDAGQPGVRTIAKITVASDGVGVSASGVHAALRGSHLPTLPTWGTLEQIVRALRGDVAVIKDLWKAANAVDRELRLVAPAAPVAGEDLEEDLVLPPILAARGISLPAFIHGPVPCEDCHGDPEAETCPGCDGDGIVELLRPVPISIPPGTGDGDRLLFTGLGTPGRFGGDPGDLYLNVLVDAETPPRAQLPAGAEDSLAGHGWTLELRSPPGTDLHLPVALTPDRAQAGVELPLQVPAWIPCEECDGAGVVEDRWCEECAGEGRVWDARVLTVRIPAGVTDGRKLRCPGRGSVGPRGGQPGDLYLLLTVREPQSRKGWIASMNEGLNQTPFPGAPQTGSDQSWFGAANAGAAGPMAGAPEDEFSNTARLLTTIAGVAVGAVIVVGAAKYWANIKDDAYLRQAQLQTGPTPLGLPPTMNHNVYHHYPWQPQPFSPPQGPFRPWW